MLTLRNITCTWVATGVILRNLECNSIQLRISVEQAYQL